MLSIYINSYITKCCRGNLYICLGLVKANYLFWYYEQRFK